MGSNIQEIKTDNFIWLNILRPTAQEAADLKRRFHFTDLDLNDMLPPLQRPKLTENDSYLFLTLLFPVYNRRNRRIHSVEADFFIGQDFLVSVISDDLFPLRDFLTRARKKKKDILPFLARTPAHLAAVLLDRLEKYCHPMLVHVGNDIDNVEAQIFAEDKKRTLSAINEILLIKTNIVNFRKAMSRHSPVINKLTAKLARLFPNDEYEPLLKNVIDRSEDTWALLEDYMSTIDALHATHSSLLNVRANSVMQTFTIFTTLIFSSSLIVDLLSLRRVSFGTIVSSIILASLLMLTYFRKRKWL